MKHARSLYLGGAAMAAEEADYADTAELGLTCPFCSKAVFLVKAATRVRDEKTQQISAHFSHYKADSADAALCEARAITREGREYLQQLSSASRGQRLDIFNRRLWAIIAAEKDVPSDLDKALKRRLPADMYARVPLVIEHCRVHWLDDRHNLEDFLRRSVAALSRPQIVPIIREQLQDWQNELDDKLHYAICAEVIDYLATATATECFEKLIKLSVLDAHEVSPAVRTAMVHQMAVSAIALTRWTHLLSGKFSRPVRGEGFGSKKS